MAENPESTNRIYADNAATSWPKPDAVIEAISAFYRLGGSAANRGTSADAMESGRAIARCRQQLCQLIGSHQPKGIVFTHNATDSLNLAIHGVLRKGDHVVATVLEHNSTLRPLQHWIDDHGVTVDYVEVNESGVIEPDQIKNALQDNTRLVCVSHASNVTGVVQPIEAIGAILKDHPSLFLVDAAQSLGQMKVDVNEMDCDLLVAPGHKGLYGPLGTGILYVREGVESEVNQTRFGGTGTQSEISVHPTSMPEKFEAGNPNVGGLMGMAAGMDYVLERGIDKIQDHGRTLVARFLDGIDSLTSVEAYHAGELERCPVVSFNVEGLDPRTLGSILETSYRIQTRSGFHCSPMIHRSLGTFERGGTVRVSFGCFNTIDEVDTIVEAVKEIATS